MGVGPSYVKGSGHVCYDSGDQVRKDMQKKIDEVRAELEAARRVNPDPSNWELLEDVSFGLYIAVKLRYPNCTNYEGVKVLVYKATLSQLVKQKSLDPHFSNQESYLSPIARFEPTDRGWVDATEFAKLKNMQMYSNIGKHTDRDADK
jgi:hypothetical protein